VADNNSVWLRFGDQQRETLARVAEDVLAEWSDRDPLYGAIRAAARKTLHDAVYRDPTIYADNVNDLARRLGRLLPLPDKVSRILDQGFQELCENARAYHRAAQCPAKNSTVQHHG